MSDLEALYQGMILDHNRRPKNYGELAAPTGRGAGRNPLCGDEVAVGVRVDGDRIAEIAFTGKGCAISRASASLMTQAVKGKRTDEVERLWGVFHDVVTGKAKAEDHKAELGSLVALGGVAKFPVRVKCATMPWHTLQQALGDSAGPREPSAP